VVLGSNFVPDQLGNMTERDRYIQSTVTHVQSQFLDGINVDFEYAVPAGSIESSQMVIWMKELRSALKAVNPYSQLTFDVAWSPECIDGRCYDFLGLAEHSDFLFVMDYDVQSQIFPPRPCAAYANCPLDRITVAMNEFMGLGIDASQLVMGVPWYGFRYQCMSGNVNGTCAIKKVPFRNASCSDAAGIPTAYSDIVPILEHNITSAGVQWDSIAQSPYAFFHDAHEQLWILRYDDPKSIALRMDTARSMHLRGVGMWNVDLISYANQTQVDSMWGALEVFFM
jgi:Di-N-acetylchitobiase